MAILRLYATDTEVEAICSSSSEYGYFKFSIFEYYSGTEIDSTGVYITENSVTFSGLEPGTRYSVYCNCSYNGTSAALSLEGDITTDEAEDVPIVTVDYWSWTSSNGSATATQTRRAYTAVTSNGWLPSTAHLPAILDRPRSFLLRI